MERQPVSQDFQDKLIKAAREGDIYAYDGNEDLFTVQGAMTSLKDDEYVPLDTLYEMLHVMTQPIEYVYGQKARGFVFGSGPVDAHDESSDYALYLRNIISSQNGFGSISNTDAGQFLNNGQISRMFSFRVTQSAQAEGIRRPYRDVMMGYRGDDGQMVNGLWDAVSEGFADQAHGHIVTITPWADNDRIFVRTELPILIHNENVETINGLPREDFKNKLDGYIESGMDEKAAYARLNDRDVRSSSIAFMRDACYDFAADLSPPVRSDFLVMAEPDHKVWLKQSVPVFDEAEMARRSDMGADEKFDAHEM